MRVQACRYYLITTRRFVTLPFREMTVGDLYAGLNALQSAISARGAPYRQNTKHSLIMIFKPFLLWMIENGYSSIPADKVHAIRAPAVDHNTTAPEAPAGGHTSRPEGAAALFERLAAVEAGIRDDRHRQPAEVVETVAALWAAGATVAGIAARTGISRESVRDRLRRAGALQYLFRNRHRHVQDVLERHGAEMIAAYEAGATISALAARVGVSPYKIRAYLVTHGIAIRNHRRRTREILEARSDELVAAYEAGTRSRPLRPVPASVHLRSGRS